MWGALYEKRLAVQPLKHKTPCVRLQKRQCEEKNCDMAASQHGIFD
ncbi:hypothetical protein DAQ1742_03974 [Dickeya aquatica]|uniref:Uncharacterized protein n=1 Tax=Dickeya aquatica TaxID=1401087 RepID=A0A375AFW0_9GAMM|nr:hypothetical protein DAQ1742_03974 [Dickeya aquatica]